MSRKPPMLAAVAALLLFITRPVTSYERDITAWTTTECGTFCYQSICNSTEYGELNWRELYYKCDLPRPVSTEDPEYTVTAIILFVIQTLFFIPRVATRALGLGQWLKDDTSCVAAYVLLIAQFVLCILQGVIGCYVHFWDLDFEKLPDFYKVNFARAQLYAITLAVTKMSILFFYQRIFDGPKVRRVLWATHVFNGSLAVAYFIAQFFVSQPLYCEWTFDQGDECTYHDAFDGSGAYSALNAALDLWMVLLAAFLIWKLQMEVSKRLSVIALFATGILTFCSALFRFIIWRLSDETKETTFPSLTWATYYGVYIELTCCFIIACLPAIRQLVDQKILPTIRNYTSQAGTGNKGNRAGTNTAASSSRLVISQAREIRVTSSALEPAARKHNDRNPEDEKSKTSRKELVE